MLEFHMSDRDLTLNPADYINNDLSNVELIVHAVEQYEDGFIFDLANNDSCIVKRSFNELERLISHVETLRLFFKQKESIPIVLNLGGFTNNDFLDSENYKLCLERVIKNLNKINKTFSGYNFMPQTMPPFPWHQGGRSFHNLLTNINKLKDFLDAIDNNICLDISHTALSCFHYNENIIEHIETIGEKIGHIHLSDAQGNSEEGLEVGNGTLDFKMIHKAISKCKKDIYLIPEIWQGHLHEGEPFFRSLCRYLELIK